MRKTPEASRRGGGGGSENPLPSGMGSVKEMVSYILKQEAKLNIDGDKNSKASAINCLNLSDYCLSWRDIKAQIDNICSTYALGEINDNYHCNSNDWKDYLSL